MGAIHADSTKKIIVGSAIHGFFSMTNPLSSLKKGANKEHLAQSTHPLQRCSVHLTQLPTAPASQESSLQKNNQRQLIGYMGHPYHWSAPLDGTESQD